MYILRSDLLELRRQNDEINFVQEYAKNQTSCMKPVSLLKIWTSYKNYRKKLQEQRITISDIQTNLKLDGRPFITSDQTHRNVDLENLTSDRKNVIDTTRKSIVNQYAEKSTAFRSKLINRAGKFGMKEFNPFSGSGFAKPSLAPTAISKRQEALGDPKRDLFEKEQKNYEDKSRVRTKIEDLLVKFEKNLLFSKQNKVDSIASEAVRRSLFGVFAENFQNFKGLLSDTVKDDIFKKVFQGSKILSDVYRIILYFNLPLKSYTEPIIPTKIFPVSEDKTIKAMLEAFEKKGLTHTQPNVILMKVDKDLVVGGYASHGWSISEKKRGDSSCFLFNIKHNFRFEAVPGKSHYQETISKDGIKFGDKDLVIENDFKRVTCEISGEYFVFGTHLLQNKLDSLIPDTKQFEPEMVEIWSLVK